MLLHTPGIWNSVFLLSYSHVMLVKSIQSSNLNKHDKIIWHNISNNLREKYTQFV